MLKGLSRLGLLEWLDTDPGKFYFRLIPAALLFFAMAMALEWRHLPNDSRYFYPIAVVFTFAALSGLASTHKQYQEWLAARLPWTKRSNFKQSALASSPSVFTRLFCSSNFCGQTT